MIRWTGEYIGWLVRYTNEDGLERIGTVRCVYDESEFGIQNHLAYPVKIAETERVMVTFVEQPPWAVPMWDVRCIDCLDTIGEWTLPTIEEAGEMASSEADWYIKGDVGLCPSCLLFTHRKAEWIDKNDATEEDWGDFEHPSRQHDD